MLILAFRPEADRGSGGSARTVATFDCQISAEVRMFGLALRQRADGAFRAYPPKNSRNCASATFAPALTAAITAAAVAELNQHGGRTARDNQSKL